MTVFWVTAGALVLTSGLALLLGLRRGGAAVAKAPAVAHDIAVYRDQLAEIARDAGRGLLPPEEAERLRIEVSRRILEADRVARRGGDVAAPGGGLALPMALVVLALAGGVWLYTRLGAPGYPDMPLQARIAAAERMRTERPSQAEAEAQAPATPEPQGVSTEFQDLMEKLRATMTARPDDLRGQQLLARNEAQLGHFAAAATAQGAMIRLMGENAGADEYASLAELLVFAAGGYVSPEAEKALTEALRRDPRNGTSRYYSGLMFAQTGRPDRAFTLWRDLLESSSPEAPWVVPLKAQIGEMAARAGVRYEPQAGSDAGPDAAALGAAAGMSDEGRKAMIEGMVQQLNDRLAREGGPAADWAKLITSLGVLGQPERARAIWAEAQGRFAGHAEDLARLRAAAEQAGVAQ
ncbi:MAG: c-type cytochrome biogenesis protein CcmI [Gemmobacter sp.]|nr:c-type cytochrome biogenesis protein CcmI [Gemmobacter sp.]